jgi:hypothetical protein
MFRRFAIAIIAAGSCLSNSVAHADCSSAISSYNSAVDDISTYLKRYVGCVSSSDGNDDCSTEFRRLKNAQSDFESAVSEHQINCNQ